jgi:hypothetical protein
LPASTPKPPPTLARAQLATAKIPAAADEGAFLTALYQHVATLNQNGRNLPFVLPLKVDRLPDGGFSLGLLRRGGDGAFASAVDIIGCVESVDGAGRVLFLRMFEGPAAFAGRTWAGKPEDRLEAVIQVGAPAPGLGRACGPLWARLRARAGLARACGLVWAPVRAWGPLWERLRAASGAPTGRFGRAYGPLRARLRAAAQGAPAGRFGSACRQLGALLVLLCLW